jgi:hypothetical protein
MGESGVSVLKAGDKHLALDPETARELYDETQRWQPHHPGEKPFRRFGRCQTIQHLGCDPARQLAVRAKEMLVVRFLPRSGIAELAAAGFAARLFGGLFFAGLGR